MAKACDVSVWTYWPLVVCVCDDETGEVRDYLPERTCTFNCLCGEDGWICTECGKWQNRIANYCPNCGAKVVEE